MFYRAAAFNPDIRGWNTAQVGSMGTVESTSPRDTLSRCTHALRLAGSGPRPAQHVGVYVVINQSCFFGSVPLAR